MRRPPRLLYLTTLGGLYLTTFALLLTGAGGASLPVSAVGAPPPRTSAAHQIDWPHPFLGGPPAANAPHSGVVLPPHGLAMNGSLGPGANFPSGCYNGIAYNVTVQGHTSWTAQVGNQKAQVWYQWCPRWSGDQIGLNWSYGKIYQLSGCADIAVGGPLGNEAGGAILLKQTSFPNWVNDGESVTSYHTCAGGLVWDYSLTLPGDGLYKAEMFEAATELTVTSPCYC